MSEIQSSPEVFEKCTDTIIRQVNDIGRMVDEFSSFARMPKPVMTQENLAEILKAAIFPQKVAFSDINFELADIDHELLVLCDNRLIVQALSNLLKNAAESVTAKMSEAANSPPGVVRVEPEVTEKSVRIHIIDNGLGLPVEERSRLAEPYMTTRAKGTGLGLAIVKKVAEEHGGALSFHDDNRLGGETGARVTLTLPRTIAAANRQPTAAE